MSNKVYDVLKYIGRFVIPALTALWLTVGKVWNLPLTEEIGATIAAIGVFWNAVLQVQSNGYNPTGFNQETLDELFNGKGEDDE